MIDANYEMEHPKIIIKIGEKDMTQEEVVEALIRRDERVTQIFFFNKCRPLFISIIDKIFDCHVDYDEFVSELYLYLMQPGTDGQDAHAIRSVSFRSSLFSWLSTVAIRFFLRNKNRLIGNAGETSLSIVPLHEKIMIPTSEEQMNAEAIMQVEQVFELMKKNKRGQRLKDVERYILVIRLIEIYGREVDEVAQILGVNKSAVYNIKMRAMNAFRKAYTKDLNGHE